MVSLGGPDISFDLHYFRNFSSTISMGSKEVEGVKARTYSDFIYHEKGLENISLKEFIDFTFKNRQINVLSRKDLKQIKYSDFDFCVVCDFLLFRDLNIEDTKVLISCEADIKNYKYKIINSGPNCGMVDYPFLNNPFDEEHMDEHLFIEKSQVEGLFTANKLAGEKCTQNEKIAKIDDVDIHSKKDGYIEGILQSGVIVAENTPLFSVTKNKNYDVKILPVNSRLISGAVLEVIMFHKSLNVE